MSLLAWIVLGLISGFIASKIFNKTGGSLILHIMLGIVGVVVIGAFLNQLGALGITGLNIYSIFFTIIDVIIVFLLYHACFGGAFTKVCSRYGASSRRPLISHHGVSHV